MLVSPARLRRIAVLWCVGAVIAGVGAVTAASSSAVGVGVNQSSVVAAVPATNTPNITDGVVYAITQVGSQIILGGTFTGVQNHGSTTTLTRSNVLAFDASTGTVTASFAPTLDGTVEALAPGPTANTVYIGGVFNNVNGVKSKGITLVNTTTGAIVTGFKPPAIDGIVYSIAKAGARVYLAGTFTVANAIAHKGIASLNQTTGALDPFMNVQLAGHHNFNGTSGANGGVGPRAMAINPQGTRAVVIGNFKTADGLARDQAVLIDLDGPSAAVDPTWATQQFTAACFSGAFDTYVTDVQYSADGSYFAITATGGSGTNVDGSNSLCDTASRWEAGATGTSVKPTWVDYTGQDSLWTVAITGSAIYVGGHQRWLNNSNGFDFAGTGAVPRPGIAALDPASGTPLSWNPGRNPRGAGAYALYVSPTGVYVGSDTDWIGDFTYKHQKIAFFPLAGGAAPASTNTQALPANFYEAGQLPNATNTNLGSLDDLAYRPVSGTRIGALTPIANTGVAWSTTRGAFMLGSTIFYGSTDGNFYRASFNGSTVGTPTIIDPYNDPTWSTVQTGSGQTYRGAKPTFYSKIPSITGAFYASGRLYYSVLGQSALFSRWFNPDSGIVGSQEFTTAGANFSNIAGMLLSGSTLYYANGSDGTLHTVPFTNGTPDGTHDSVVSGPSLDGNDWRSRGLFLFGGPTFPNILPVASATSSCTSLTCAFDGTKSADADGPVVSYDWNFGDGSADQSGVTTTHGYAQAGTYNVSLTVTDDRGGQSTWTATVIVTAPASQVAFVGRSGFNGTTASPSVVVPAGVSAGNTELLFVSAGTAGVTTSLPTGLSGWQQVALRTNSPLETTVFRRLATAGDTGATVTVPLAASSKVDLELVVYSGASSATLTTATGGDSNATTHVTPTVAVTAGGSWVVSYWADRTSNTTTWALPTGVVSRGTGLGVGGGRVDTAIADSGQGVPSGTAGGFTASSGQLTGKGDTVSVVLVPGP